MELRGISLGLREMANFGIRDITKFVVHRQIVETTLSVLQTFGNAGCEGLVLWVGSIEESIADVKKVVVPEQNPIREETGVGYFVTDDVLFSLNRMLEKTRL